MTPLDVTAFVAGSIVDNAGNALDNSMPAGQNITDNQGNIYIDTTEPTISGMLITIKQGTQLTELMVTVKLFN